MRRAGLLALSMALFAGCGLPDDREPRAITAGEAPIDLTQSPDANPPALGGDVRIALFLVRAGFLEEVDRLSTDGSLTTTIGALLAGTTTPEEADQLLSLIPDDTVLRDAPVDSSGVATLNLGCDTGDAAAAPPPADSCGVLGVGGGDQLLSFGQLACTANEVNGVTGVRFQQEGQQQLAPLPDLGTTAEPVQCNDYRSLLGPPD